MQLQDAHHPHPDQRLSQVLCPRVPRAPRDAPGGRSGRRHQLNNSAQGPGRLPREGPAKEDQTLTPGDAHRPRPRHQDLRQPRRRLAHRHHRTTPPQVPQGHHLDHPSAQVPTQGM